MTARHIFSTLAILLVIVNKAVGGPVVKTDAVYTQPDGTTFIVKVTGDEWTKIRQTTDGCAIIKDNDGWWCYGIYDTAGILESSGHRVGDETPGHIISSSRKIPYEVLSQRADMRRRTGMEYNEKQKVHTAATRSDSGKTYKKAVVILAQFQDVKFKHSQEDFMKLLNEKGYNGTGSAKDYYEEQFGDQWEFSFDVSPIVTLPKNLRYYGTNDVDGLDIRPAEMVRDACLLADSSIDFSAYDLNGDRFADNVYIFYAGLDESTHTDQTHYIWAHQYYIYSGTENLSLECDGVKIDRYACSSELDRLQELTGIGPFCHEYAHTLGLIDFYDTDYDSKGGWAAGLWRSTSLMDGGNYNNNSATPPYFNCMEREMLGLSSPLTLETGKSYILEPVNINGAYYRIDTDTSGEYYLLECRSNTGWDKHIGGQGLLIYHIDKNATVETSNGLTDRWSHNLVNADHSHQCADLLEADGRSDRINVAEDFMTDIAGIFFPQSYVTSITSRGHPSFTFWNGNTSDISITGIKKVGDDIHFNVVKSSEIQSIPSVQNASYTSYPDAATIRFNSSDTTMLGTAVLKYRKSGSNEEYTTLVPTEYETGRYVCKLERLESGHISYEVFINFKNEQSSGKSTKLTFMTKKQPDVTWPYMYFPDGGGVWSGQGIELHIVNAAQAQEIEWTYNDEPITLHKDMRFYPENDGVLKARLTMKDGSAETILKNIFITTLP